MQSGKEFFKMNNVEQSIILGVSIYLFITLIGCILKGLIENNRHGWVDSSRNHMVERLKGWLVGFAGIVVMGVCIKFADSIAEVAAVVPGLGFLVVMIVVFCFVPLSFFPMIAATSDFSDIL